MDGHPNAEAHDKDERAKECDDHPLSRLPGDVQVDVDRRVSDIDIPDVEDRHEERGADDGEDQPAARVRFSGYVGQGILPLGSLGRKTGSGSRLFQLRTQELARADAARWVWRNRVCVAGSLAQTLLVAK